MREVPTNSATKIAIPPTNWRRLPGHTRTSVNATANVIAACPLGKLFK
jgi:hypothetical protein